MGKGSVLEGKSLVIGGLIQQDTEGKVEHIRKNTTNVPDSGVDYERIVKDDFEYFEYIKELKNDENNGEEK